MKKFLGLICPLVIIIWLCNMVFAQELVTGKVKQEFKPGDKVLLESDFHKCPVGEMPEDFNKISGAGECVKYNNHIWVAPSTNEDFRLYKKMSLYKPGENGFSLGFNVLEYQDIGGAIGPQLTLRFLESRGPQWDNARVPYDVQFRGSYNTWHISLEGVGEVGKVENCHKKKTHLSVQVRRNQFRIFADGRRLVSVPFDKITPNQGISGFEFMWTGDTNAYGVLLSDLKVAKYTKKEAKPTPEKLGVSVENTESGMKLRIPEKILFDFNKFILKPKAKSTISVIADFIRQYPACKKVVVIGYTDNIGSDAYNLKLSLQRAQSVADYLLYVEKLPADIFVIEGKGKANPIADNSSEEGRAKNRRVEINIIK